eukprot:gb/GECG01013891.1/.p1 GENE.gb/GECG01013891.1/~~gb/GECG01013891.1/.p1  ORF type:complete len:516 (+),score=53.10 gb/GECG01013891.1/:1-1548(+)
MTPQDIDIKKLASIQEQQVNEKGNELEEVRALKHGGNALFRDHNDIDGAIHEYQKALGRLQDNRSEGENLKWEILNNIAACELQRPEPQRTPDVLRRVVAYTRQILRKSGQNKDERLIQKAFYRFLKAVKAHDEREREELVPEAQHYASHIHANALQTDPTDGVPRCNTTVQNLFQSAVNPQKDATASPPATDVPASSSGRSTKRSYRRKSLTDTVLPSFFRGSLFRHAPDGVDENLFILMHGLGDTPEPFVKFGETLALPQTAVLALKAPYSIPLMEGGYSWVHSFDPLTFEPLSITRENRARSESLFQLRKSLDQLVGVIQDEWNIPTERIHLLGFSQGGTAALDYTLYASNQYSIGTCTAVNAALYPDLFTAYSDHFTCDSQIILSYGQHDTIISKELQDAVSRLFLEFYHNGCLTRKPAIASFSKGHQMVNSKEEIHFILEQLAPNLRRRMVHLEEKCDEDGSEVYSYDTHASIEDAANRAANSSDNWAKVHVSAQQAQILASSGTNDGTF